MLLYSWISETLSKGIKRHGVQTKITQTSYLNSCRFVNLKISPNSDSSLSENTKKHHIKPIFSHSGESSLTPSVFRSTYQPITALNHLSLSLSSTP